MKTLVRSALVVAAMLMSRNTLPAQMGSMPMDHSRMSMPRTDDSSRHRKQAVPEKQPQPASTDVPFGRVADGSSSGAQMKSLPQTQAPLHLGLDVQEQERPDRRTGTLQPAVADLLVDARARSAQPLAFFTARALAQNPTIREANAQVLRLRAEAKQQGLWDNPEIGYEADHVRGGIYHSGEQGGYVQQVVPIGGQRSSARAAMQQRARQAEVVLDQQKVRVTTAVQQLFYAALALQVEVHLRDDLMHLATDAARTAHQLANVGQADAPDILQSEVEREQAKLDYATSQREYRKAFSRLAAASGEATLPISPLQGELADVPVLTDTSARNAADTSVTLQVASQAVLADEADVRSARRRMLPQLTVHAGLQQDNEPLEAAQGRVGVVGVAQAGISVPLWNRNQGGVEAARASVMQARAALVRTQLQLRSEAEITMQDYANAVMQVRQYKEELLPRAERAYQLYQQKYTSMAAAYPQVLVSQRTLFQLRIEYVRALASAWQNALLLQNGLLSGGLQQPDVVNIR